MKYKMRKKKDDEERKFIKSVKFIFLWRNSKENDILMKNEN